MKRLRGWGTALGILTVCAVLTGILLQATAHVPELGEAVEETVNDTPGVTLTMEKPRWTPFKGYVLAWTVTANTDETYTFHMMDGETEDFAWLERWQDGQWRCLISEKTWPWNPNVFSVGGENAETLQGSLTQKDNGYGTRLEAGRYRLVLEMRDSDGAPRYLAAEFTQ